jgi:penicillin-binding protein 2
VLIFDQLRRADRQLRWLAGGVLCGMLALVGGLWHVQIMSGRKYAENLKDQSYRNVLIAAPRGKIMDRNGALLAENQPRFVVNLYLEDLRGRFTYEYTNRVRKDFIAANPGVKITSAIKGELNRAARYNVVSNIVWEVSSAVLPQPLILNEKEFAKHYSGFLALPMPLPFTLTLDQVALFMERAIKIPGVELEVQPMRFYPHGSLAVHLLGYVRLEKAQTDEDGIAFEEKTKMLVGGAGLESIFDDALRGKPGVKSILVNNLGYRQHEEVLEKPISGSNIRLTLDLEVQKAAERALVSAGPMTGTNVLGAAVAMDVRTGEILAVASSPSFDPNLFLGRISHELYQELSDTNRTPMLNRAFYGSFQPGSTFKIVTALAALEAGLIDPKQTFYNPGYYMVGRRRIKDTAPPGNYDFVEAFIHSSNSYFIEYGLRAGAERLIEMGNRFGLGERTGVVIRSQETPGYFPESGQRYKKSGENWMDGDTANLSIGQGEIIVTPLQMAILTAAVANGGKVLKPRVVAGVEDEQGLEFGSGPEIVNEVKVSPQTLAIVREAMFADVHAKGAGGAEAFVPGFNVCGKTGTAQVRLPASKGGGIDHTTWFVAYAPYESPRYAVAVMVEHGGSGGGACAPKAREIFKALQKMEQRVPVKVAGVGP